MINRFLDPGCRASWLSQLRRLSWGTAVFLATVTAAWSGPQGGEIVAGQGSISLPNGRTTLITQNSANIAIDWSSFNVAAHERVVFQQPSASASALNRIFDQNPSQIFGAIDANGRVFLLNPNGVVFGRTSRVNLQSLVASSLDMSVDDFMRGNYNLKALADREGGLVLNQGEIRAADGGSITLIGGAVANEGLLIADYGSVNLAAGRKATLDFTGEGLMLFTLEEGVLANDSGVEAAVSNSGQIAADGGQVLLTARSAGDVFDRVVNNSGVIRASRIDSSGGVVRLIGNGGVVAHEGRIDVSGLAASDAGGRVELLGDRVGLFGDASIDATGGAGGGDVYVGGGLRGQDQTLANSDRVYLGPDASLDASAVLDGDGGTVVVFGTQSAQVYGAISARGGSEGGNGGFVETSGKERLQILQVPDTRGPLGSGGEWLIDPYDLMIVDAASANVTPADPFIPTDTGALLNVADVLTALNADMDVTITTDVVDLGTESGTITWVEGADLLYADGGLLSLIAAGDIIIQEGVTIAPSARGGPIPLALSLDAQGNVVFGADNPLSPGPLTPTIINLNGGLFSVSFGQGGLGSNFTVANTSIVGAGTFTSATGGSGNDSIVLGALFPGDVDGGAGDDTFTLSGGVATEYIGGAGTDTLIGDDTANAWVVNAPDAGTLNTVMFSEIENLTGGSMVDTFDLQAMLTGVASGGGNDDMFNLIGGAAGGYIGGANSDTLTGDDTMNDWVVDAPDAGTLNTVPFSEIENLTGGSMVDTFDLQAMLTGVASGGGNDDMFNLIGGAAGGYIGGANTDTLTGDDTMNDWVVDAPDAGTLNTVPFSEIENLTGGSMVDTFDLQAMLTGVASGGGNDDMFNLIGGAAGGYIGGANTDTLTGDDTMNDWVVDAPDAGTLNTVPFSEIENLTGGSMVDTFDLLSIFGGTVSGLGGVDTFMIADAAGAQVLSGGDGIDLFDFAGAFVVTMISGGADADTVDFADVASGLTVDLSAPLYAMDDIETFIGNGTGTLQSGGGGDMWTVTATDGTVQLGGATTLIGFSGFTTLEAGAGTDSLQGPDEGATVTTTSVNTLDITFALGSISAIEQFTGGIGVDMFTIDFDFTGDLDGGAGDDVFNLNALVTGTLFGNDGDDMFMVADAAGAQVLSGGDGIDLFDFAGGFVITTISGGADADTVDFADVASGLTVDLSAPLYAMDDIETFVGNGTGTLQSGAGNDMWAVAATGGTVQLGGRDTLISYSGFETLDAGAGTGDTLQGPDEPLTWTVSAVNTLEIPFSIGSISGIEQFIGGDDVDTFNIDFDYSDDLDGGAGNDIFNLNAVVAGTLFGNTGDDTFTVADGAGAQVLSGGDGIDLFDFAGAFAVTMISGGDDADTVDFADVASGLTVDLSAPLYAMDDIETFIGNGTGTLQSGGGGDMWTVTATDGTVQLGGATTLIGFSGFTTLEAGAGTDSLQGPDEGATVTTTSVNTLDITFALGSISAIEQFTAGIGVDTFNIDFDYTGDLDGGAGNDIFNVNALVTGSLIGDIGDDTFNVADGAGAQTLSGGDGIDLFDFAGGFVITTISGGADADTVDFADVASGLTVDLSAPLYAMDDIETFVGNGTGTLQSGAGNDVWTVAATGGTVQVFGRDTLISYSGFETLDAGAGMGDTLQGPDEPLTWEISPANTLVLPFMPGQDISGIEQFMGGNDVDTFNLNFDYTGDLDGGAGPDIFNLTAGTVTGTLFGGLDADVFNVRGGTATAIEGGAGNDTLSGNNTLNNWVVNALDEGTLNLLPFMGIENLAGGSMIDTFDLQAMLTGMASGGADDDTFDLNGGAAGEYIGGGDTDTLIGDDTPNAWVVNAPDAGTLNAVPFSEIENLTGGSMIDTFDLQAMLTGMASGGDDDDTFDLNGGAAGEYIGGGDTDTLIGDDTANAWVVNAADAGTLNGVPFSQIENLTGGSMIDTFDLQAMLTGMASGAAGDDTFDLNGGGADEYIGGADTDTLIGDDTPNAWVVNAPDAGTLNLVPFSQIENLTGGSVIDTFDLQAALTGTASGAAGDDTFDLNGGSAGEYAGGADSDTLMGDDTANAWVVNAPDAGTLNGVPFSQIEYLAGGSMIDTFDLQAALTGTASGGDDDDTFDLNGGAAGEYIGGADTDTLIGDDTPNAWVVNAPDAGTLNGVPFSQMENLTGGSLSDTFNLQSMLNGTASGAAGDDTFDLNGGAAGEYIGGVDTDTLVGDDTANAWVVNAPDAGTLNGVPFSQIEHLAGGSMIDTFNLQSMLSGTASGAAGDDTFDLNGGAAGEYAGGAGTDTLIGDDTPNAWVVNAPDAGTLNLVPFSQIEHLAGGSMIDTFDLQAALTGTASGGDDDDTFDLNGGAAGEYIGGADTDTLIGDDTPNAWVVNTPDAGTLNTVPFSQIENLTGGSLSDTFNLQAVLTGMASGAAGDDTFDLNGGAAGEYIGGADADTLIGDDTANAWVVNAPDAGTLNAVPFSQIEHLAGGSMIDTFNLQAALTGTASGAAGNDTFDLNGGAAGEYIGGADTDSLIGDDTANAWVVSAPDAGTLNLVPFSQIENLTGGSLSDTFNLQAMLTGMASGAAGDDTFDLNGGAAGEYVGGADSDTLIGDDTINVWVVTGPDAGTLNTVMFSQIENLTGGSMSDNFELLSIVSGTVSGLGGDDTIQIAGDLDLGAGALQLDGGAGTDSLTTNGSTISAALLRITDIEAVGSGSQNLATAVGSIEFVNVGNAFINEQNDIDLSGSLNGGLALTVTAGGVTNSQALSVGGTTDVNATGDVVLDNPLNTFTGEVMLTTSGNAALVAAGQVILGSSTIGNELAVTALADALRIDGEVQASSVVLEAGNAISEGAGGTIFAGSLQATANNGINLNNLNSVSSFGATNRVSGEIVLDNTGSAASSAADLLLSSISQAGGGAVTIINGGSVTQGQGGTIVAPLLNVTSNGGLILDNSGNQIAAFTGSNNTGAVTLRNDVALQLMGFTQSGGGPVNIFNAAAITQTGSLTNIDGQMNLTLGSGDLLLTFVAADTFIATVDDGSIFDSTDANGVAIIADTIRLFAARGDVGKSSNVLSVSAPGLFGSELTARSLGGALDPQKIFLIFSLQGAEAPLLAASRAAAAAGQAESEAVVVLDTAVFATGITPYDIVEPGSLQPCDQLVEEEARCQQ